MANYRIIYSPTGGTKKCAELLCAGIARSWEDIDISLPHPAPALMAEDLCVVAVPSFGGRVPDIATAHLAQLRGNGARAILLCVYGNRAFEDTLVELQDILEQSGFICVAAVAALAEHSIMRSFAAGRPDREDEAVLSDFACTIRSKLTETASPLVLPGNRPYKEYKVAPMVPDTNDRCTGCALCAAVCPADAIDPENPSRTDPAKCTSCMRCTVLCPHDARFIDPEKVAALTQRLKNALGGRKENQLFI